MSAAHITNAIVQGETFTLTRGRRVDVFRRETDDPAPLFDCERVRVTHVSCSDAPSMKPYTFGTELAWFTRRGLVAL